MDLGYRKTKMNSSKMRHIEIVDLHTMKVIGTIKIAYYDGKYGKDLKGRIIVCDDGSRYKDLGSHTYWLEAINKSK